MIKTSYTMLIAAITLLLTLTTQTIAGGYKVGDLTISHPVARATVPGAKVGGGYLSITNNGSESDRLVGGAAAFAKRVEIHQMTMVDEVMRMSPVEGGLEIKPGETVELVPGGYHVMFMKLGQPLKEGEKHKVTLTFEKAGNIDLDFAVKSIADTTKKKHGHEGHSHSEPATN